MRTLHGGNLGEAARHFGVPRHQWLNLSSGDNCTSYPVPDIPTEYFQHLPDDKDQLRSTALEYYQSESLIVAPGTQRLIQCLPLLRTSCRVAVPDVGYPGYQDCWHKAGHTVCKYNALDSDSLSDLIRQAQVDVAVVINPNDITATLHTRETLLDWANQLAHQDGWLIVDESFIDGYPDYSLMTDMPHPGLIVLRSLSSFFGLAGLRVGFASAPQALLETLEDEIGLWPVSGPARWLAIQALSDRRWVQQARERLLISSLKMQQALYKYFSSLLGFSKISSTPLFVSVNCDSKTAEDIYFHFCQQGILIYFSETETGQAYLRFNVIDYEDETAWQRFQSAAASMSRYEIMDFL